MARSWGFAMILLFCFAIVGLVPVHGDAASEMAALFALQAAIADTNPIQWNASLDHCQWQGVSCISGAVTEIRLPGQGLKGQIPKGILGNLPYLTVLSLSMNLLSGALPDDLTNCHQLTHLIMDRNLLSGALPSDFSVWPDLWVIDLSYNNFNGLIPQSIANLTSLGVLLLQNNSFTGLLPQMDAATLLDFSVANNRLSGAVPVDLVAKFSDAAFSGNTFCGPPLAMPCFIHPALPPSKPPPPSSPAFSLPGQSPHTPVKKLGAGLITAIVIVDIIIGVLLLLLLFYVCRKLENRPCGKGLKTGSSCGSTSLTNKFESSGALVDADGSKLVFFKGANHRFNFEDLLESSAKTLGQGSMGSSYRAALEDGSVVVVKHLKLVNTMHKELRVHLEALGRLHHPNLLLPRGCYLANHVKLLVYDYYSSGSLSTVLHGNRGVGRVPLDWVTRVQIVLGAARGIAYLHDLGLVHGNIKSTNVLIKKNYSGCVSDFGLTHLLSPSVAVVSRNVGYRAPETLKTRIVTQKADVYSFGVLLLELLTGKEPMPASPNDNGINLPHWVQSVICEEWTTEVFDLELMRYQNIEDEMVQMLQIAMGCIDTIPGKRPHMSQVVMMLEGIRPVDSLDKFEGVSVHLGSFSPFYNPTSYIPTSVSDFSESMLGSMEFDQKH